MYSIGTVYVYGYENDESKKRKREDENALMPDFLDSQRT